MAVKIAVAYALLGALWILCSGRVLHYFVQEPVLLECLENVKGWCFVLVTGGLLAAALDRYFRELRRSAQLLQASEERWNFALNGAGQGVWDWDVQTNQVFRSASWKTMLGFERHEVVNSLAEWETRIHPEDWPQVQAELHRHLEGQTPMYSSEHRVRCRNGTYKWALGKGRVASRTADGKPLRMIGIYTDITERKQVEQMLQESLLFRRQAEKIGRIGAWKASPRTDELYWTEGVYELLEAPASYKPGLEEGMKLYDADSIPALREGLMRAAADGTPFVVEAGVTTLKGRHIWTEVRGLGRVGDDDQAYVMGTFQDITERKELESQLRQSQKLEAIGQLAGGVAHDFNNILAAILMRLGLLQMRTDLNPETKQALKDLDGAARRAAGLTRQLLMFSRRSVLAVKPLDLNEVVADLLKMLRRLIGENIDLRFDGKSALPLVKADVGMLEQVLMNLAVNARDAMPKGGQITIGTSVADLTSAQAAAHPNGRPGRFVCLTVADTGCGMDAATLKRIFEPFFTTKEAGKGTGLGLATAHGIVAQHKGWIEVDSQVGVGTTFRVYLPATARSDVGSQPTFQTDHFRRGGETILLAEDEAHLRQATAESLRALGYQVHEAANGQEAMTLWQTHGADVSLLLTDMVMPEGLTGLELTEQLQTLKPGLKAIISSGYSAEIAQAGVPNREGIIYLPKPYTTKALARQVRDCLDQKN
jgi:two-component system, cell cycle sensor histidine kinase and response regulator CckA